MTEEERHEKCYNAAIEHIGLSIDAVADDDPVGAAIYADLAQAYALLAVSKATMMLEVVNR